MCFMHGCNQLTSWNYVCMNRHKQQPVRHVEWVVRISQLDSQFATCFLTFIVIPNSLFKLLNFLYNDSEGILLQPPIQFGDITSHYIRIQSYFANPSRCCLSQAQQFFRYTATTQWNNLPNKTHLLPGFIELLETICCLIYLFLLHCFCVVLVILL